MAAPTIDVVGIGNAIVDVLAQADESFITAEKLAKGTMALIDEDRARALYERMGSGLEASGGSAANTIAGIASLGGKAAYIGKVADDLLGKVFAHDLRATGVRYETAPLHGGPATARCLILVTPDAQRTMNTFLGASVEFQAGDIDRSLVEAAQVTYLEGYLFDRPLAKAAFRQAGEIAHKAGRKVSLTLSDPFCVDRHRADFRDLIRGHVDILFANEAEICSLYETKDFAKAADAVRGEAEIAVLTRSEKGATVITAKDQVSVPAAPVARVVDTTGAGDLFASGFLYGYTRGKDFAHCAKLGALCAAEIISHFGARPEVKLKDLAAKAGLA
ncbi:MAG TPA: adenosine kinase [Stellaceae bacterium]|jgi:sugar/nucleoside kinase (ribokinase family)|nr:adenosine kinase [Stellaceae bacterium]